MVSSNLPKHQPVYNEFRALTIVTLLSIATVIGSGILALPVSLFQTSVLPFIFLFTLSALSQVAVICTAVELFQRARLAVSAPSFQPTYNSIQSDPFPPYQPPDVSLFTLCQLYLSTRLSRISFYVTTYISFIALLISYGLAGPQALWQLISPQSVYTHTPALVLLSFWAIGTACVVFLLDRLLGVFGTITVLKCTLFSAVVVIVAVLPPSARISSVSNLISDSSQWQHCTIPFLMSCVALGSVVNTMPITFKLVPLNATPANIRNYRTAVILAILLCYLLNIAWVLAMLQVVPREAPNGAPSLTNAYTQGQISTVPLVDVLHSKSAMQGDMLHMVQVAVGIFVFISTGVSFFIMSAGLKNFVDAALHSLNESYQMGTQGALIGKILAYIISFGSIIIIVLANPNGFITILTNLSSFAASFQAGLMVFIMLYTCRSGGKTDNEGKLNGYDNTIPVVMSKWVWRSCLTYGLLFFFVACCLSAVASFMGISSHPDE